MGKDGSACRGPSDGSDVEISLGDGWTMKWSRERQAMLYDSFPDAPKKGEAKRLAGASNGKGLVVWGAGTVGLNAAENANQMGMNLTFIDISEAALDKAQEAYGGGRLKVGRGLPPEDKARVTELLSGGGVDALNIGVLIPGAPAPTLLTRGDLAGINGRRRAAGLKPLVVADASIDQGGAIEGEEARTHDLPVQVIGESPVCTIANMPGSRHTAAYASRLLQKATLDDLKLVVLAAARGWESVLAKEPLLASAINTMGGRITHGEVARKFQDLPASTVDEALEHAPAPAKGRIKVAVPAEIKPCEHRAGLLPSGVRELADWARGIGLEVEVAVDIRLGAGMTISPNVESVSADAYAAAGAKVYEDRGELMDGASVLHFVKEPQGDELEYIGEGASVHTYFHYTGFPRSLVKWALDRDVTSVAYETRRDGAGNLPSLAPMSHVDGRSNALMIAAMLNPEVMAIRRA